MTEYLVGPMIRYWREQNDMSTAELADNIMHPVTLWRIENGISMPTKRHIEAIFEKLGINPNSLSAIFMNDTMVELQEKMDLLDNYLVIKNIADATRIIEELEHDEGFLKNKLNLQYLLFSKAVNARNKNEKPIEILAMLTEAINIPRTKFFENRIEEYFLTKTDIHILELMATQYFTLAKYERAVKILYHLKKNIENHCVDKIEKGRRYPHIIYSLTRFLGIMEKHSEVLLLCDEGIDVCLKTRHLEFLPDISMNKAFSLCQLGDNSLGEQLLHEAYHTFGLYQRQAEKEMIQEYACKNGIVL